MDRRDAMVAPRDQEPRRTLGLNAHVILLDGGGFKCERCGRIYVMALPAPLEIYLAASRAFGRLHADCPKPKTPAAVVDAAKETKPAPMAKRRKTRKPRK